MKHFNHHSLFVRVAFMVLVAGLMVACGSSQTAEGTANTLSAATQAPSSGSGKSPQPENTTEASTGDEESEAQQSTDTAEHETDEAEHTDDHMAETAAHMEDDAEHMEGSNALADDESSTDGDHDAADGAAHGHDEAAESHEDMAAMHGIPEEAAARENPIPANASSIERGTVLFQTTCAVCHGSEGKGDGPGAAELEPKPANLSEEHVQGNTDGALFYTISNGVAGTAMVGWAEVYGEEDRWHLVNFLRTLDDH